MAAEKGVEGDAQGLLLTGLGSAVFSVFVIVEGLRMPRPDPWGMIAGPGFVPLLAGAATLILSAWLTFRAAGRGGHRGLGRWLSESLGEPDNRRLLWIVLITGLYVILLGRVSFFVATLFFHALIFTYLKVDRPVRIALYSLLAAILVAVVLPYLFDMPTP